MGLPPTSLGLLFRHQRRLAGQLVGHMLTPPVFVHRADTTLALAVFTFPDTNGPELSTPGRAEAHQSGTCTCPETSHTSVAAADLGRRTSAGRATTRDPGTGSSRHPNHHAGRCR